MQILVIFEGAPIAQKRHRHRKKGNHIITFNPNYVEKERCKQELISRMALKRTETPLKSPISLDLGFYIPIPQSWSKKRKECSFNKPCVSRPDIDNYLKFYLDILSGIMIHDDAQVYEIEAFKIYSDQPRTEITINYLNS